MVEDSDSDDLIHWSEQGLSVVGMCESYYKIWGWLMTSF